MLVVLMVWYVVAPRVRTRCPKTPLPPLDRIEAAFAFSWSVSYVRRRLSGRVVRSENRGVRKEAHDVSRRAHGDW